MCMPRFSPSGFFEPSRCLISTPGLTSEYTICAVCVCVCVYTHIHPHTLPPALRIEKTQTSPLSFLLSKIQTSPLSFLLSKITPRAKQQVFSLTSWTPPSSFPNAKWTNCTYMSAYAHPVASVYANVYADVHNTCLTYTHAYSPLKMHMHSCMRAYASVQKILCHESYCEPVLSLVRASYRLSFAARTPAGSMKSFAWRCSLKKSVQIHASSWRGGRCGVAQASFDHPHWCGPHPVCLWFWLALGRRPHPRTKFYVRRGFRGLYLYIHTPWHMCVCVCKFACTGWLG